MKPVRVFISIFFLFSFLLPVRAQFPADIPYQSFTAETPALPGYLQTVEDTSVPDAITIRRISEYDSEWDWYPTHSYSKIQPWNADATLYKIRAVALYDAATHQKYRDLPGGEIYPVYWSNTNSDLMYSFREDGAIKTYTVSTDSVQTIYNLTGYDIVKLGPGEGNIDKNDHFVALVGKNGIDMDVIIFDLQTNQIIHTETFAGAWGDNASVPEYVDWVSVSQSGNYVGIMWDHNTTSPENPFNGHYGVEIYNTTDMQYLRRIAEYGNHGDFGYATDGDEVFVQFWGPTGTVNMYYLNRIERVVLSYHPDFNGEGHISCRNLNRPGWAYISQDYPDHSGQIVAMKLDNSGLVEHFGHHFSSSVNYTKSPMPVPTPNGDKIMFKSDFGHEENPEEVYIFEAKLSETLYVAALKNEQLKIYPNPGKNILNVLIAAQHPVSEFKLYNINGNILLQSAIHGRNAVLNTTFLPPGTYVYTITSKTGLNEKGKWIKE